jgi:outer membrane protein OmpA-like peptidoglycan-associated protein
MQRIEKSRLASVARVAFVLLLASIGLAQDASRSSQSKLQERLMQVPAGQKLEVEGVITDLGSGSFTLLGRNATAYKVTLGDGTEVKERKSNPFRGARTYSSIDLVPGLQVEVKGMGDSSGSLLAREIRVRNDDFKVAQTMDARVVPVENRLRDTQARLSESEQNAQRLSGQIQEVSGISNAARSSAKTAQESADSAMLAANDARSVADRAKAGVQAANERITSLDDYNVKVSAIVHFKAGSAILSAEEKSELEKLAEQIKGDKGFLVEVAGFASSDGDESLNRRLSQKRADAVIQYMAENFSIPLRRFITPMGYGESQPVGDNKTHVGRKENRRVEVRILVNKGLTSSESAAVPSGMSMQALTY